MFFFHSFSVIDTQTKTYVFVSLRCHIFDSDTKTKCFCFTQFLVIYQWCFVALVFGPVGIPYLYNLQNKWFKRLPVFVNTLPKNYEKWYTVWKNHAALKYDSQFALRAIPTMNLWFKFRFQNHSQLCLSVLFYLHLNTIPFKIGVKPRKNPVSNKPVFRR